MLLAPICLTASAQLPEWPPFQTFMDMAKIKKVITVDTAADPTRVLITAMTETPAYVFTNAPGGEGTLLLVTDAQRAPTTQRQRVPIYPLAPAFL